MQWKLSLDRPIPPRQTEEATLRRNTRLGVGNGIAFSLAEAFSDANLVLTVFVRALGASPVVIGLLPALKNGGWLLPQLLSAGRLQALAHKLPVYRRVGAVRFGIWILIALLVWFSGSLSNGWLLAGFLLGYSAYSLTGGAGSVAFQEVVAKTIPTRRRGAFFGTRNFLGGLLAFFVASPIVAWVLSRNSPFAFPSNFGVLLTLSLICIGVGIVLFSSVSEPPTTDPPAPLNARRMLALMPKLLRENRDFRRYVGSRMITRLGGLADPFYILYAREVLNAPPRMIGIYLALRVLAAALSNLPWARVADRHGIRLLIILTGGLIVLVPLWALLAAPLGGMLGPTAAPWVFGGVFLLVGLSIDGSGTAGLTYVMELAPAAERPLYMGVSNTLMGLATFFPVLGGVLIDVLGYMPVFSITALLALWGLLLSIRLPEPRTRSS